MEITLRFHTRAEVYALSTVGREGDFFPYGLMVFGGQDFLRLGLRLRLRSSFLLPSPILPFRRNYPSALRILNVLYRFTAHS